MWLIAVGWGWSVVDSDVGWGVVDSNVSWGVEVWLIAK